MAQHESFALKPNTALQTGPKPLKEYACQLRGWMALTRQVMAYNESIVNHYTKGNSQVSDPFSNPSGGFQPVVHLWDANGHRPTLNPQQGGQPQQTRTAGTVTSLEVHIPPTWKRAVAEILDCIVLLILRVLVSTILINLTGWSFLQVLDYDMALISGEIDLEKVILFSSEIYAVELIHRVFVSLYEASCLAYTSGAGASPGGFTLGKRLMGIMVIECDHVYELQPSHFTIIGPMRKPTFTRAAIRSFIKNFSVSFMMPTFVTVYFYNSRRALHDTMSGTMVVQQV